MGGGDLNLKKSWHPTTYSNLKKVWEAEQADAKEKQKIDQLLKEKKAERDAEELRRLQEKAGIIANRPERIDWMYSGGAAAASSSQNKKNEATEELVDEESEEYLTGKKKFDAKRVSNAVPDNNSLIARTGRKTAGGILGLFDTTPTGLSNASSNNTTTAISRSAREQQIVSREDPMTIIKQAEIKHTKISETRHSFNSERSSRWSEPERRSHHHDSNHDHRRGKYVDQRDKWRENDDSQRRYLKRDDRSRSPSRRFY